MVDTETRIKEIQGNKQEKMKLKKFYTPSFASYAFILGFLLILCAPKCTNGLCDLQKDGTHAHCHHLRDVKFINTHGLDSLKVSTVENHLYPKIFANLTNLKHLDLSNGLLRKIETNTFQHLQNLRSLNLSNNHLTYLKSGTLKHLKHLHSLNLSKNYFKNIPSDIVELNHLKYLDMSKNNINCNCKTLKQRDILLKNGVKISKNTICSGLHNLDGKPLIEPDADAVCLFDDQDMDMQGDQPINDRFEGSGEGSGSDPFDEINTDDVPGDDDDDNDHEKPIHGMPDTHITTSTMPIEIPLTPETTTSSDDELFFNEENDNQLITSPAPKLVETSTNTEVPIIDETEKNKIKIWETEGSGDDDTEDPWVGEGSGFEGSGIRIVSPINWDGVESKASHEEDKNDSIDEEINSQPTSSTTTEADGIVDTLYKFFWGPSSTSVEVTTTNELSLEEEQFILASSTTQKPEHPVSESIIPPPIVKSDVEQNPDSVKNVGLDGSKSGKVQVETPVDSTESPDASTATQSKKGMGSYVVLAVLLAVLGALIGFAAYKGDFCKSARKRNNNRHPDAPDIETGTELKDLTKSLLDNSNSTHPKISSSNGGKPETVPLVTPSRISTEIKNDDEPTTKYVGTLASESLADPVKPPRKSFSPNEFENGKKNGTNGKYVGAPELSVDDDDESPAVCPKPLARDSLVNGKNDRDSLSSIGRDSPSPLSNSAHLSNPRLSQSLLPASPHAQRVKITLQDNPDSVPKTPLLITRTKAGENLVKTP
ncbi:hypothetical protein PV327_007924 [Microctonus hyperodae]|uniref:Variable lymphocyte receptor A n=1 Tax=Microctonus hyperodae TaxID=165561 RepID=A0AA39G075_MICHY|nr:hypothetical protein PV327_007924 [Microctonus hyperodae]